MDHYSYLAITLLFSDILDLSWLIIYTDVKKTISFLNLYFLEKGYWNGTANILADIPVVQSLDQFVVLISYFSFFLKVYYQLY